ncbi:MAG TPA: flagellar basal body P-ring formation chaperone FlgA [Kofleriaceae bacterium]|nr:flagellar basal body P-ring formation chaperone FlgA [Kofleriaceae bacterium]
MRVTLTLTLALAAALALVAPGLARADSAERIRGEIQSALPAELTAIEVRVPRALADASDTAPVQVDWRRPARSGWLTLQVRIGQKSGWVRARVAAVSPTVVAVLDLPAGHVIAAADVKVELRPTGAAGAARAATLVGLEGVVGRALRAPVAAGAAVPAAALERAAPLPRGHPVKALVRRGGLSITTYGVLERPAPIGQTTLVRLRATGRVVRGRLIDSDTVLIEVSP